MSIETLAQANDANARILAMEQRILSLRDDDERAAMADHIEEIRRDLKAFHRAERLKGVPVETWNQRDVMRIVRQRQGREPIDDP